MEASGMGQPQQGGGEQQQGGEQQAPGTDFSALAGQLSQIGPQLEEMRSILQSHQQPAAAEQDPQEPEIDLSFLDPADPAFDPDAQARQLEQVIEQTVQQRTEALLKQHVDPINERLAEQRRTAEAERLVNEFPELGDEQVANHVVATARQVAEANGHPELANEPWFWRQIFMAGRAAEMANGEGTDPRAAHLEGGGGAAPAAQEMDPVDAIFEPRGSSVLPFG